MQNELLTHYEQREQNHKNIKNCHICDKGFHFRKRLTCTHCENSFCSDHCYKEIPSVEGPKLTCDICYHQFRMQKFQERISDEAELLTQELTRASEASKRVEREFFEKTAEVNSMETEFTNTETISLRNIHQVQSEVHENSEKITNLEAKTSELSEELHKIIQDYKEINKNYITSDTQLEELRNSLEMVKNIKKGQSEQLLHVTKKIKYCLDYPNTHAMLCVRCQEALKTVYEERVNHDGDLEESSMSLYESASILDSVREMKESLNALIVEPEQQPKCTIF